MLPNPILPPREPLLRPSNSFNLWSVNYGAVDNALKHAGVIAAPEKIFYAFWAHGIFGPWETQLEGRLTYNTGKRLKNWKIFTARQDEQDTLTSQGHTSALAIGAPIVYAPLIHQPRIENSLLIVPTHTLPGIKFPDRSEFKQYAEQICHEAKQFEHVFVCLHPSCFKNGFWLDEFSGSGFRVIQGASPSDTNAHTRIRSLFSAVEYVTTNGWGSHVSYALAEGAKVSIYGTEPRLKHEHYQSIGEVTWGRNPNALRELLSEAQRQKRVEYFAKHTCKPIEGTCDTELGKSLIGAQHKLTPEQMKECLDAAFHGRLAQRLGRRLHTVRKEVARYTRRILQKSKDANLVTSPSCELTDFQIL